MQDHDIAHDAWKEDLHLREPAVSPGIPARHERAGHASARSGGPRAANPTATGMKKLSFSTEDIQANLLRILAVTSALCNLGGGSHADGPQASRAVPARARQAGVRASQARYPLRVVTQAGLDGSVGPSAAGLNARAAQPSVAAKRSRLRKSCPARD